MKVTIQQFQEINEISMSNISEIDKSISYVSILTGLNPKEIEELPKWKFNKICSKVVEVFNYTYSKSIKSGKPSGYIKANGQWYELHYEIANPPHTAGRYVEAVTYSKDIIKNLHRIMASIATPVRYNWLRFKFVPVKDDTKYPHERIALDMLNIDVSVAYHSAVFFYILFNESILNSQFYLMEITKDKSQMEGYLKSLQSILDGSTLPHWYQKWKEYHYKKHGKYQ